MLRTLSVAILFFIAQTLAGQYGSLQGRILEIDSIAPLAGVHIYLEESKQGEVTNGNGYFDIHDIPVGEYTMVVSSIGYLTVSSKVQIHDGQPTQIELPMEEAISALKEVVVMTKGNTGLKDIPGSVSYISPREIEKFSYTDINRLFRAVPGINMQEEDGFGLRPNIGLRGTGVERSSKITIMEDGVLTAPAPYADPSAYYFPTIGRMQGVEVLKGSSQIKYGPYTTGGAINLISTQIPDDISARMNLMTGSYGAKNIHAFIGNSHKNVAYLAETFQYSSDGFKELDGGGNTGFNKEDYLAKIRFQTNPEAPVYQSVALKVGRTEEESNETYLGLTLEDFDADPYHRYAGSQKDLMKTEQMQYALTHFIELSDLVKITTTAYRSDFSRNWYKLDRVRDDSGTTTGIAGILDDSAAYANAYDLLTGLTGGSMHALIVRANNRKYRLQGVQSMATFEFQSNRISHHIDIGMRYHVDEADRFQWDDEYQMTDGVMFQSKAGTPGTQSNRIESAKAFAGFVQYKLKTGRFAVTPGLRYEHIVMIREDYGTSDPERTGENLSERENKVNVIIPGIGVDYHFNKYLRVFGGVHKGFSPAGSQDDTEPEISINTELGVTYRKNTLSGQAVLFVNDYSNLLGADLAASGGGGSGDLFNAGEATVYGLEFQLGYDPLTEGAFRLPLSVVYTYTHGEFGSSFESAGSDWGEVFEEDQFPYLANHQLTLTASLEHSIFGFMVSARYMSAMRTVPGQGETVRSGSTDGYFIIDLSATVQVHRNIALFANALNVNDVVYRVASRPAGWRPGMPRTFNIGIKASL